MLAALEIAPGYVPAQKLLLELHQSPKNNPSGVNIRWLLLPISIQMLHSFNSEWNDSMQSREDIVNQVSEVIVGQDDVIDQILIALFVGSHCPLTGMPGTAKTLDGANHCGDIGTGIPEDSIYSGPDAV